MAPRSTGGRAPPPKEGRGFQGRALRRITLTDRIADFPYRRLFGLKGGLVAAAIVLAVLAARFVSGIATVTFDPATCALAWSDRPYALFHQERVLANTRRVFGERNAGKQKALWAIRGGRNPFPSTTGGNVARIQRIDNGKFFWRAYAANLEKEIAANTACLQSLAGYRFG